MSNPNTHAPTPTTPENSRKPESAPLLELEGVHKTYHIGPTSVEVLRDVSLSMREGEFVAIMGASGSGKSTLLHIAGALDRPDAGRVAFRGRNLSDAGPWGRANMRSHAFGFVFQFYHLLPELSVLENVLLPAMVAAPFWKGALRYLINTVFISSYIFFTILLSLYARGSLQAAILIFLIVFAGEAVRWLLYKGLSLLGITRNLPRQAEALKLLESFGLSHRLKHRPAELSGGERQRVAIARALINQPQLLLADEPTGNLDAKTGRAILDVLLHLHKTRRQSILLVTHDPQVAALADRTIHLTDGRIGR